MEPWSPAWQVDSLLSEPPGKPLQGIILNIFPCAGPGVSGKENSREKTRTGGQPSRDLQHAAWGPALGEPAAGSQLLRAASRGARPLEGHEPGAAGGDPPGAETPSPGEAGACPLPLPQALSPHCSLHHHPSPLAPALRHGSVLPPAFLEHLVTAAVTLGPEAALKESMFHFWGRTRVQ